MFELEWSFRPYNAVQRYEFACVSARVTWPGLSGLMTLREFLATNDIDAREADKDLVNDLQRQIWKTVAESIRLSQPILWYFDEEIFDSVRSGDIKPHVPDRPFGGYSYVIPFFGRVLSNFPLDSYT